MLQEILSLFKKMKNLNRLTKMKPLEKIGFGKPILIEK